MRLNVGEGDEGGIMYRSRVSILKRVTRVHAIDTRRLDGFHLFLHTEYEFD